MVAVKPILCGGEHPHLHQVTRLAHGQPNIGRPAIPLLWSFFGQPIHRFFHSGGLTKVSEGLKRRGATRSPDSTRLKRNYYRGGAAFGVVLGVLERGRAAGLACVDGADGIGAATPDDVL